MIVCVDRWKSVDLNWVHAYGAVWLHTRFQEGFLEGGSENAFAERSQKGSV